MAAAAATDEVEEEEEAAVRRTASILIRRPLVGWEGGEMRRPVGSACNGDGYSRVSALHVIVCAPYTRLRERSFVCPTFRMLLGLFGLCCVL